MNEPPGEHRVGLSLHDEAGCLTLTLNSELLRFVLKLEVFDLLVQRVPVDTQFRRGFRLRPLATTKNLQDQFLLDEPHHVLVAFSFVGDLAEAAFDQFPAK